MLKFLLIICILSSAKSAPAEVNQLYNIVQSDNRTEDLRKFRFVEECRFNEEFSKSLCYGMFDVALTFNTKKLEFKSGDASNDSTVFCEELAKVVPDEPTNDDSSIVFKDKAQWFKDVLRKDEGESCKKNCFVFERVTYSSQLSPACKFMFLQYSLLSSFNSSPEITAPTSQKSDEIKQIITKPITLEAEDSAIAQPVAASFQDVKVGSNIEPIPQKVSLNNETVTATKVQAVTPEDVKAPEDVKTPKSVSPTEAQVRPATDIQSKPVVNPTPVSTVKKIDVDQQKIFDEVNAEDALKMDEDNNDEGLENPDLFDGVSELPDLNIGQDSEDEDEDLTIDNGRRDNNRNIDFKLPQEPEPTVDDVPHKKIERVNFEEDPDSNFFTYLCALMFLSVLFYILHQNRQKILALFLEGRRGRRGRERTRSGSKAAYSKLDCNLEEAITSKKSLSGKSMDIIY